MALIKCPECGKEVSDTAKMCVNCGYNIEAMVKAQKKEIRKQENKGKLKYVIFWAVFFSLIAILIIGVIAYEKGIEKEGKQLYYTETYLHNLEAVVELYDDYYESSKDEAAQEKLKNKLEKLAKSYKASSDNATQTLGIGVSVSSLGITFYTTVDNDNEKKIKEDYAKYKEDLEEVRKLYK